jgi:DNA invertase Pin-like site-specific DNA recombinase
MEQENKTKMVYALYPRRSSEAEDKQVLSIDAQIDELKKLAKSIGLDLASLDIRQESHSAKAPRSRPVWNGIIKDIEKGKLNGIIAWQANRLSRNAVDTGEMIYLMDTGKLAEVVTPSQVFRNTPNDKMMLNFFCMVAKFENDNKGVDVKRGLNKKAGKGYLPSGAKPGYMNDLHAEKGNKKLFADPVRFPIIKEAWRLMLTGLHTPHHQRPTWLPHNETKKDRRPSHDAKPDLQDVPRPVLLRTVRVSRGFGPVVRRPVREDDHRSGILEGAGVARSQGYAAAPDPLIHVQRHDANAVSAGHSSRPSSKQKNRRMVRSITTSTTTAPIES